MADKGIRPFARAYFVEQNELRRRGLGDYAGKKANTVFRKEVMCKLMEEFGCTLAAAATHYNDALRTVRELNAELVDGLGRPEDKKGGRKPKAKTVQVPTLLLTWNGVLTQGLEVMDDEPAPAAAAQRDPMLEEALF